MSTKHTAYLVTGLLAGVAGFLCVFGATPARAAEVICAEVKIEIHQELTLERQAFDAHMRIHNGFPSIALDSVDIDVSFVDGQGEPVLASSNPDNTNALFFITIDTKDGITDVDGGGTVHPKSTADIHWLIIPAVGAAGPNSQGTKYLVGAKLRYIMGGVERVMDVQPDYIFVKPMPLLVLDYFLPVDVYGDDAFTGPVEPPVPFSLGVRVANHGYGAANKLKIDSGQPEIVENDQGLLIGFVITGSEVNGTPVTDSLLVDFGDIEPNRAGTARWVMECTLSGRFKEFTAEFSHADELGGALTSLMDAIHTHLMVHDVIVDLPGRDSIRDFLARDEGVLKVFESDNIDTNVADLTHQALFVKTGQNGSRLTYEMTLPATNGPLYAAVSNSIPPMDTSTIVSVLRADGKRLHAANAWFSKSHQSGGSPWNEALNLFDANGGGAYTVTIDDISAVPAPPVVSYVGDRVTFVNDPLGVGFLVYASDPNGTLPSLSSSTLPTGATFDTTNELDYVEGTFFWRPQAGQEGVYPVQFTASDGVLTDHERIKIYVGAEGEGTNSAGIPLSLVDWRVEVSNIVAEAGSMSARVQWAAWPGVDYDVLGADGALESTGTSWSVLASNVTASSYDAEWLDGGPASNRTHRFYQVAVAGDGPLSNGMWGVVWRDFEGAAYHYVAPPLDLTGPAATALRAVLSGALHGADDGPGNAVGDELYLLQPSGAWRVLYLDTSGTWRTADGQPVTALVPAGRGAVLLRHHADAVRAVFTGPVGNDGTREVTVYPGWNMLALCEGKTRNLTAALASTVGGGPAGGLSPETADHVLFKDGDGRQHWLIFALGFGPPKDGHWIDRNTLEIRSPAMGPGSVMYYYRQPAAGEMRITY